MEPTLQSQAYIAPQPTQPVPSQLQAVVSYLTNVSIFGAKDALLEWTADNRIRLFEMNFDTNQAVSVIFDVALSEIEKISGTMAMLVFVINGQKYRVLFTQTSSLKLAAGGLGGIAASMQDSNASGINLWTDKFKQAGIQLSIQSWKWSLKVAGIIVGVLILFIIVFAVIVALANN